MHCGVGVWGVEWQGMMGEWVVSYKEQFRVSSLAVPRSTVHLEVNIRGSTCQEMMMARGQAVH